ncbi:DUF6527 family protein [Poseidonibacter ostreae]|uniref:DUF6527 family protein n=1 Tax=Poseidonibacter ostreae TaxID=2654171 RepID=UPI00186AC02B|nr:DUF6527 family protein [Poseidonibacter ostreae]
MKHKFLEFIPEHIEPNTIYISIPYATAIHKCCCGCNEEVVTPLTPSDWSLTFNGESISLNPSIGNWSFKCRSHYWIKNNKVIWAGDWSQEQVDNGRMNDLYRKEKYYKEKKNINNITNRKPKVNFIIGILNILKKLFK